MNLQNGQKATIGTVTPDMIKKFKTLTCDCGGMIFEPGMVVKKLSSLVTGSGKEELYPMEVLICKSCGKVPTELNKSGVLPDEVSAIKQISK